MPRNLEHETAFDKGEGIVGFAIARVASLVEAVYIFFWGHRAIEREDAPAVPASSDDDRKRAFSALTEFRAVRPQI